MKKNLFIYAFLAFITYYNTANAQILKIDNSLFKSIILENEELFESKNSYSLLFNLH